MASAGARGYNGGLGAKPQRGPRAEPLVMGLWGNDPCSLKVLAIGHPMEANLPYSLKALRVQKFTGPL